MMSIEVELSMSSFALAHNRNGVKRLCFIGLCGLLLLMPFHYFICEVVLSNSSIDNLWRDVVIVCCSLPVIASCRHSRISMLILLISGMVIVFSLTGNSLSNSLNMARIYFVPMLVYYLVIGAQMNSVQREKLYRVILYSGLVAAIFGIIQVAFLGNDYLLEAGYAVQDYASFYINGYYGVPRLLATFASPNDAGAYFVIALLVSRLVHLRNNHIKKLAQAVILIALLLTFSRSAYVALALSLFYMHFVSVAHRRKLFIDFKIVALVIACIVAVILALSFIPQYGEMLFTHVFDTASGNNLSLIRHLEDLYYPLSTVLQNPLGLGFGENGPQALQSNPNANLVESGIYIAMYEFGPLLGLLFFLPVIWMVSVIILNRHDGVSNEQSSCGAVSVAYLVICAVLPVVQNYILPFYSYLFIGLYEVEKSPKSDIKSAPSKVFPIEGRQWE